MTKTASLTLCATGQGLDGTHRLSLWGHNYDMRTFYWMVTVCTNVSISRVTAGVMSMALFQP